MSKREEARWQSLYRWRGLNPKKDTICPECQGAGVRLYSDSGTWQQGLPGVEKVMTRDVCDKCWGSGAINRPFVSLHAFLRQNEELHVLGEAITKGGFVPDTCCECGCIVLVLPVDGDTFCADCYEKIRQEEQE